MTDNLSQKNSLRAFVFGGLLPVLAFTLVEEVWGIVWGLVVGMVFGVGEILYEWIRYKKVDVLTWFGNGIILGMGGISLFTQDGVWFKLQPSILEGVMGLVLLGSVLMGKPLLLVMANKQNLFQKIKPAAYPFFEYHFKGLTLRLSLFFFSHAALAWWAALHWTTSEWAMLKGIGFTVSMLLYLVIEMFWLRRRIRKYIDLV